jgi:hypothetical protein
MNHVARMGLGTLAAMGLWAAACTGGIGSEFTGGSGTGGSGAGSGSSNGGSGGIDLTGSGAGTSNGGNENSCGDLQFQPELVGVDMFITVDKSGSMSEGSPSKWESTKNAFFAFFQSPEADNLSVALRFWPDAGCDIDCNLQPSSPCAQPQVPLDSLSNMTQETALINAFNARSPGGLTPMEAALAGAEVWALAQQMSAETGRRVVVVLLTDGLPTACSEDINVIKSYAANAYAQAEILTFAVGLQGSAEAQMDQIAVAGGTSHGYFIGAGNAEEDLLAALKDIQEIAVACTFAVPESPDPTKEIDPDQVDIEYDPGNGDPSTEIPQVDSEGDCTAAGGWYYDDNNDPSIITLCPASCELINNVDQPDGKLSLTAGCKLIAE